MPNPARRQRAATLTFLLTAAAAAAPTAAHASIADAKRGYELVSPPGIGPRSVEILPPTGPWSAPITDDGRALVRIRPATPGTFDEPLVSVGRYARTTQGWSAKPVVVPQAQYRHDDEATLAASRNLATVVVQPVGVERHAGETLLPGATDAGQYFYAYASTEDNGAVWLSNSGAPRDYAGDQPFATESWLAPVFSAYVSDDGSTTLFTSKASLTADVPTGLGSDQLYVRRGPTLSAAAKRPDGSFATSSSVLARGLSADGNVVLFEETYAVQADLSQAAELVVATPTGSKFANRPRLTTPVTPRVNSQIGWATLTPDGKTVLFTTREQLVDDDTDASEDLYRYEVGTDALSLLSRGSGGAPGGNADDCSVVPQTSTCDASPAMASRDGQTVYFFAPEQLDGSAGSFGTVGLYVVEGNGAPHLVASLPARDTWIDQLANQAASRGSYEVTGQGDLVFESNAPLPGSQFPPRTQVWRYDRSDDALRCLSCRRGGAVSEGPTTLSATNTEGISRGTASIEAVPTGGGSHRVTSDGSTVFVTSYDRLVQADQNAAADVYAIDVATGQPHLITTGRSLRDSYLSGIDADGTNVFFMTGDTLDPRDDNGPSGKLYVARKGGGSPPPPDGGGGCRGAACRVISPQAPAVPLSGSQGAQADATAPTEETDPEIQTPSSKTLAKVATKGRLPVRITSLTPGQVVALRVRVRLSSRSSVSTTVTSRGGAGVRTLTARFSRSQRLRILAARSKRALPVELRLDYGQGDPAVVTSSITRVRKGR